MTGLRYANGVPASCAEHHDPVPVVLSHGSRHWVVVRCGICGCRL